MKGRAGIFKTKYYGQFDFPFDWLSEKEAKKMQHLVIVPVSCPCCRNGRLFDIDVHTEGNVQIKCPMCRSIVSVVLHNKTIHTERIGA